MTVPALVLEHFDPAIRPQDDLYRHVNGAWLATATIPDDRANWGAFAQLREDSELAVRDIITGLTPDADPHSEASLVAKLYASFMDEARIEALGVSPLQPILQRIDAITTTADLAEHWGWANRHGLTALFGMGMDVDPGDPQRYIIFFDQDGLGLPDEEYYRDPAHAETKAAYLAHVEATLRLAGFADAAEQANAVLDLETRIAAQHWDKVRTRDMVAMYHPQSWAEFTALSPQLEWEAYLRGAKMTADQLDTVVNSQRTFYPEVAPLVNAADLPAWRSWARWHAVSDLAAYLSSELATERWHFYQHTLRGVPQQRERWKRGVALTEGVLGEAIGKIYVERHFPPEAKARMDELVDNLLEAYRRSISSLEWMGEETRAAALKKLSRFTAKIGYPNKWRDYSGLRLEADDVIGNVLRANSFELDYDLDRLHGPVDRDEWFMYPQTVNAYYHPLRNEIVFPAAILQPPFFNVDADDAVNYGAIGAVIGHEIGHGFDDQGSHCDGDGLLRNWWTDADRTAFEARTRVLVDQYGALSPAEVPDVKVNGELTLGENIGDLGGLSIAFLAWQIAAEGHPATRPAAELLDGYTPAQRVFLAWAAAWQELSRPEAIREQVATDPHSPDEIRCNQTSRNIDAFHEAFGTAPGDAMWLAPHERVRIW